MKLDQLVQELEQQIMDVYDNGVSTELAERLAARCLVAQLSVSKELRNRDLDARNRKSGLKAIRAAIRLDITKSSEKKPTESTIDAMVDTDTLVSGEQAAFDLSEVERNELERLYDTFGNSHIFFRGITRNNS